MINLKERVSKGKQEIRQAVQDYMEKNNLVSFPRPCHGKIPNFIGSRDAKERLKTLAEWRAWKMEGKLKEWLTGYIELRDFDFCLTIMYIFTIW